MTALVLFAHGSSDPRWAEPFRAIQRKVAVAKPELAVELAFLEIMAPTLSDAVENLAASGHARITIAPLFMAEGAHLKRDLAAIIAALEARHPGVAFTRLPAVGEVEDVLDAIGTWLVKHA